jgi:transcriptional regulator with XRE-family HTH domain
VRLRDLREDRDLTQAEVASYLCVKQNTYSQYETGTRQLPIDLLIRLAQYYGVSTDYILELTDNPAPYPPKSKKK